MVEKNNKALWVMGGIVAAIGIAAIYNHITDNSDQVEEEAFEDKASPEKET
jgi:hypothetical protein